jgi:hypothetical protein
LFFCSLDQSDSAFVLDTPSQFNVTDELDSWKNTNLPGLARGSLVWSRVSGSVLEVCPQVTQQPGSADFVQENWCQELEHSGRPRNRIHDN